VLVPDLPAAFFLGAAVTLAVAVLRSSSDSRALRIAGGIGVGLLLGLSWLCKESVAYAAPFFLILAAVSLRKEGRKHLPMWVAVAASSATVLLLEASVYRTYTGDWLFHLHEMERNYSQNTNAFLVSGSGLLHGRDYLTAILRRLFLDGPQFILTNRQHGYLPALGVIACVYAVVHRDRTFLIPGVWLLSLLFMFNFASSSTRSYVPLVLSDRYLFPLALPSVVVSAGFLARLFRSRTGEDSALPLERRFWGTLIVVALAGTFALKNRANLRFSPDWNTDIRALSAIVKPSDRVYADILSLHGLEFFWSFPDSANTVNFEDMASDSVPEHGAFVVVNPRYLGWITDYAGWWPTESDSWTRPGFLDAPPSSWKPVWTGLSTTLYKVDGA
jgi:hypothetical protein